MAAHLEEARGTPVEKHWSTIYHWSQTFNWYSSTFTVGQNLSMNKNKYPKIDRKIILQCFSWAQSFDNYFRDFFLIIMKKIVSITITETKLAIIFASFFFSKIISSYLQLKGLPKVVIGTQGITQHIYTALSRLSFN